MRTPKERAGGRQQEKDADLIDTETLFPRRGQLRGDAELDDAPVPQITRMPEGITVVEQQIGHACGQWVFVILCDCGRRWFSLHAQEQAQCPRCERWVHIDAELRNPGG